METEEALRGRKRTSRTAFASRSQGTLAGGVVMDARVERAKRLVARLKDLGASFGFDEDNDKLIRVDLPADSVIALQRVGNADILSSQVSGHLKEIADIVRPKIEGSMILTRIELSERAFETLENFELMLSEHPEGVKVNQVFTEFPTSASYSAFCDRVRLLVKLHLITMTSRPKSQLNRYLLPADFKEQKSKVIAKQTKLPYTVAPLAEKAPEPMKVRPAPVLEEPGLLNGLPYTPSSELQTHLGAIIEALESLKTHIVPTLALLLDLDRDFERYTRVREKLGDLKKELLGVQL